MAGIKAFVATILLVAGLLVLLTLLIFLPFLLIPIGIIIGIFMFFYYEFKDAEEEKKNGKD